MTAEKVLIVQAQQGNQNAFRQLVDIYARRVFDLTFDLTGNHADAEDLTQEVFIKVYRHLAKFRGDSSLMTWIHRITINSWINMKKSAYFKRRQSETSIHEKPENALNIPELNIVQNEFSDLEQHIEMSLARLSKKEKIAFVLRHYHELQIKEIARMINVTPGTVKSLLFRAVLKLRKSLEYYEQEVA
jgi:RNA polymerase sigma-70 factor (ECF subfamily)